MIDRTARESCDTSYHEARSVASDEAEQDQHSEPSAAHDGSVASETPYNAEWLSELIGTASVLLKSSAGPPWCESQKGACRSLVVTCVHAGHLWNPELRKAFEKVAWDLLPDLLQKSSPPWMRSIKLTRYTVSLLLAGVPSLLSTLKH